MKVIRLLLRRLFSYDCAQQPDEFGIGEQDKPLLPEEIKGRHCKHQK